MGPKNATKGNFWTSAPQLPVPTNVSYYMGANGTLTTTPPPSGGLP